MKILLNQARACIINFYVISIIDLKDRLGSCLRYEHTIMTLSEDPPSMFDVSKIRRSTRHVEHRIGS